MTRLPTQLDSLRTGCWQTRHHESGRTRCGQGPSGRQRAAVHGAQVGPEQHALLVGAAIAQDEDEKSTAEARPTTEPGHDQVPLHGPGFAVRIPAPARQR